MESHSHSLRTLGTGSYNAMRRDAVHKRNVQKLQKEPKNGSTVAGPVLDIIDLINGNAHASVAHVPAKKGHRGTSEGPKRWICVFFV